jgi:hypothetical protein
MAAFKRLMGEIHTHTQFIPRGGLNPKGQLLVVYIQFLKVILVSWSLYILGLFVYFSALFSANTRGLVVSGVNRLEGHSASVQRPIFGS